MSLHLRLPATSANLGPGFDTVALALDLFLEVDAEPAGQSSVFSIAASGRSTDICSVLTGNLLLATYADVWTRHAAGSPKPLALTVRNGIPLGMGCGSSAASRLAGIALASHFAELRWSAARMLDEAAALEHHPDNAAACCLGGFAVSGYGKLPDERDVLHEHDKPDKSNVLYKHDGRDIPTVPDSAIPPHVHALRFDPPPAWHALLALPEQSLATTASRAVLPERYSRADIVENLQHVALLVAAFAQGQAGLLRAATGDRLHQPYRGEVCPLLPRLLPLAGSGGILSVTLSGAGAGVLLLLESKTFVEEASRRVLAAAGEIAIAELLPCALSSTPARLECHDA